MARPRQRKSDAARQANLVIRRRTTGVMVLLIGAFLVLLWRLYDLQINRHEEMQNRAVNQQTRSAVISASRGPSMTATAILWRCLPRRRPSTSPPRRSTSM